MLDIILKSIGVFIVGVYIVSLGRVWWYERDIDKLYSKMKKEINNAKKMGMPMSYIDGKIKNIKEEYDTKIEELERKRRFILEKLTFRKK